jgi:hypothetical protein
MSEHGGGQDGRLDAPLPRIFRLSVEARRDQLLTGRSDDQRRPLGALGAGVASLEHGCTPGCAVGELVGCERSEVQRVGRGGASAYRDGRRDGDA